MNNEFTTIHQTILYQNIFPNNIVIKNEILIRPTYLDNKKQIQLVHNKY